MIFGATNRKQSVLRAMNLTSVPLMLQPKYGPWLAAAKKALSTFGNVNSIGGTTYTVVHWRRGDQLKTRCSYKRDQSVNCGSAEELIRAVRKWTKDKIVYIATNEPPDSVEYKALQSSGYALFDSIKEAVVVANQGLGLSMVDTFALEWALMVDASTFIGFGLTEIKDVVEHERMLRNKTFCLVNGEENAVVQTAETGTWCDIWTGNYSFFRTGYVDRIWVAPNLNSSRSPHITAGGIVKNGTVSSMTKQAAVMADSEDQRAAAKNAQNGFFQPLPKPPPVATVIKPQPGVRTGGKNQKVAGAKHAEDREALAAKVDPSLQAYYVSLLKDLKSKGKLQKKRFSSQLRVLAVAGLEGTGHHGKSAYFIKVLFGASLSHHLPSTHSQI